MIRMRGRLLQSGRTAEIAAHRSAMVRLAVAVMKMLIGMNGSCIVGTVFDTTIVPLWLWL